MKRAARIETYKQGVAAENRAALYLMLKGYRIRARRYKTPVGEIDLIATKGRTLVAVEVKTRKAVADALDSVTPKNRARVTRALEHFIVLNPGFVTHTLRFDVMIFAPPFRFLHLDNAWGHGP